MSHPSWAEYLQMRRRLLAAVFALLAGRAAAEFGIDMASVFTIDQFSCLRDNGISFAVMRVRSLRECGTADQDTWRVGWVEFWASLCGSSPSPLFSSFTVLALVWPSGHDGGAELSKRASGRHQRR